MPLPEQAAITDPGPETVLATLRVRSGARAGAKLPVRRAVVTVGAVPGNDVVLDSPGVAPRHAKLRLSGGVWTITTLGPAADLDVDGEAVREESLLAPGSALRIGDVSLVFDPAEEWHAPAPERSSDERTIPLFLPPHQRPFWPTALFVLGVLGVIVVLFFLFRTA
ncbi:MAG TPA: FHA domain-containing protein [Gemmatimonadales bacterium]